MLDYDAAIEKLLFFLKTIFSIMGQQVISLHEVVQHLLSSLYKIKQLLRIPNFHKFVVCLKCNFLYKHSDCLEGTATHRRNKRCSYRPYPFHPRPSMRSSCNTLLLKTVELSNKNLLVSILNILLSWATYSYHSKLYFKGLNFILNVRDGGPDQILKES